MQSKAKKTVAIICIIILALLVIAAAGYFGLGYYYQNSFSYGTYINGMYVTGMTVEEVNQKLVSAYEYDGITITDKKGLKYTVSAKEAGFAVDYTEDLTKIKNSLNPYYWGYYYLSSNEYTVAPVITVNEDMIKERLAQTTLFKGNVYEKVNKASIVKTSDRGYVLVDNTKDTIKQVEATGYITEAIANAKSSIDLSELDVYADEAVTPEYTKTLNLWKKIEDFQSFKYTYQINEDELEVIDESVVCDWMLLDENGDFVYDENGKIALDETKIYDYAKYLADKYDTVKRDREFLSTRGDIIKFEGKQCTYGNDINEDKEAQLLLEAFLNGESGIVREPEYVVKAMAQGENDIGDTYVEADLGNQHLYYYKDGELVFDTDVVSGCTRNRHDTPTMVCYVYFKQKNRTLHGENYTSFVYYWMAIRGAYGIHDATWRNKFGGELYKSSGSHGCINLPKPKAAELYEILDVGTPVVVFY